MGVDSWLGNFEHGTLIYSYSKEVHGQAFTRKSV